MFLSETVITEVLLIQIFCRCKRVLTYSLSQRPSWFVCGTLKANVRVEGDSGLMSRAVQCSALQLFWGSREKRKRVLRSGRWNSIKYWTSSLFLAGLSRHGDCFCSILKPNWYRVNGGKSTGEIIGSTQFRTMSTGHLSAIAQCSLRYILYLLHRMFELSWGPRIASWKWVPGILLRG
jgi:hypothetical protein